MSTVRRLATDDADFEERFAGLLAGGEGRDAGIEKIVADIVADVRARGDAALVEYTQRFDGFSAGDPREFLDRTLGPLAGDRLKFAVGAAQTRAEGVGLTLASAEFNRR